uniref:hypothetical protein n=1 Tax=Streptomyces sp. 7N604 TaxID=3457415 RepID=UPI003FD2D428
MIHHLSEPGSYLGVPQPRGPDFVMYTPADSSPARLRSAGAALTWTFAVGCAQ